MKLLSDEKIIRVLSSQYSIAEDDRSAMLKLITNNLIPDFRFYEGLTETSVTAWENYFNAPSEVKISNSAIDLIYLPKALHLLYLSRPDLQSTFDLTRSSDVTKFLGWFYLHGAFETELKTFSWFDCDLRKLIFDKTSMAPSASFTACLKTYASQISDDEIAERAQKCLSFKKETLKYLKARAEYRAGWLNTQSGGINVIGFFEGSK
ncbi:MAG: hypothetical protein EOP06_28655, partial [Proteobacteria bacterium]